MSEGTPNDRHAHASVAPPTASASRSVGAPGSSVTSSSPHRGHLQGKDAAVALRPDRNGEHRALEARTRAYSAAAAAIISTGASRPAASVNAAGAAAAAAGTHAGQPAAGAGPAAAPAAGSIASAGHRERPPGEAVNPEPEERAIAMPGAVPQSSWAAGAGLRTVPGTPGIYIRPNPVLDASYAASSSASTPTTIARGAELQENGRQRSPVPPSTSIAAAAVATGPVVTPGSRSTSAAGSAWDPPCSGPAADAVGSTEQLASASAVGSKEATAAWLAFLDTPSAKASRRKQADPRTNDPTIVESAPEATGAGSPEPGAAGRPRRAASEAARVQLQLQSSGAASSNQEFDREDVDAASDCVIVDEPIFVEYGTQLEAVEATIEANLKLQEETVWCCVQRDAIQTLAASLSANYTKLGSESARLETQMAKVDEAQSAALKVTSDAVLKKQQASKVYLRDQAAVSNFQKEIRELKRKRVDFEHQTRGNQYYEGPHRKLADQLEEKLTSLQAELGTLESEVQLATDALHVETSEWKAAQGRHKSLEKRIKEHEDEHHDLQQLHTGLMAEMRELAAQLNDVEKQQCHYEQRLEELEATFVGDATSERSAAPRGKQRKIAVDKVLEDETAKVQAAYEELMLEHNSVKLAYKLHLNGAR